MLTQVIMCNNVIIIIM